MTNRIKTYAFYLLIIATFIFCGAVEASASDAVKVSKQDRKAITKYINRNYGKQYHAKYIDGGTNDKALSRRKGKQTIIVEKFRTRSNGKTGVITSGPLKGKVAGYARKQPKGKTVTTYLIYSPNTNSYDGIDAIVTKGKIR